LRADAARNRARVLAAAGDVFAEQGPNAQLLDIARRAGVGAGTVYRHFPTKEALYVQVVATRLADLLDRADALAAEREPADAFFAFWGLAVDEACRNAALCEAFASATGEEHRVPDEVETRYRRTLGGMLEAARAAGAVRSDITLADAFALLAASVTAEMRRAGDDRPGRLTGMVADALRPGV
jgi:AcrR family transcriptional regulator